MKSERNPNGIHPESERLARGRALSLHTDLLQRQNLLLTFANADTRGRAVDGPHASDSLPAHDPLWVTGKQDLTRWLG